MKKTCEIANKNSKSLQIPQSTKAKNVSQLKQKIQSTKAKNVIMILKHQN